MTTGHGFSGRRIAKRIASHVFGLAVMAMAAPATAAVPDCPLRTARYSVDTPLTDIAMKAEAKALVKTFAPAVMAWGPRSEAVVTGPALATIMTVRTMAPRYDVPAADLARLDAALRAIPVTAADERARCARYDDERPTLDVRPAKVSLLLFEKITGFRDGPSVDAARAAFRAMAERRGWSLVVTDKAGVMTPALLRKFDAVIWNNVSGDVLTLTQRRAFRRYIEQGGGFVGVHGSGGDFAYPWKWYVDTLIGAQFIGHTMRPHTQDARVVVASDARPIGQGLAPGWTMNDEWYSFAASPRLAGARIVATLDESSYAPVGMGKEELRMGDHPIAWTRCVGRGRSFYSAIGHRAESYAEPHAVLLMEQGIAWAAGKSCP